MRAKEDDVKEDYGNKRAPEGHVYVCCACGKVSYWKYGFDDKNKNDASPGWDESCMLNADLFATSRIKDPEVWSYPARVRKI